MHILALDPATHCGWAHRPMMKCGVWDLSIRRDESSGMRLIRFESYLKWVSKEGGIDLLVYEAARHGAPKMQGALVVQSELQSVIKMFCEKREIEYRGYSPSEIKKHATGKGNAPKQMVIDAVKKKWGNRWGKKIDDNQADAIWLLDLAVTEVMGKKLDVPGGFR